MDICIEELEWNFISSGTSDGFEDKLISHLKGINKRLELLEEQKRQDMPKAMPMECRKTVPVVVIGRKDLEALLETAMLSTSNDYAYAHRNGHDVKFSKIQELLKHK